MAKDERQQLVAGGGRLRERNESPWVAVFNLCSSAIGAGVLSFPYGFRETGVLGGLVFTSAIWLVEVFTLCLLVRVAEKYNAQSYQQVVSSVLGSGMSVVTSVTMLIFLIGCMISYYIITGDVFSAVFAEKFGEDSILCNRRVVIFLFGLVVILPLCLQTTLKALKYSSLLTMVVLLYLTIMLVTTGVTKLVDSGIPSDLVIFRAGIPTFIIIDIVVFAFECHIQVVPIFAELADFPQPFFSGSASVLEEQVLDDEVIREVHQPRSERLKRMDGIIFIAMSICGVCYTLVGLFGYMLFPDVESDVLINFGGNNVFTNIARIGMALVSMACYPVQHFPARSIVDDAIRYLAKVSQQHLSRTRHVLITLGFFFSTMAVAFSVSDLGKVFSIVGSSGGVMVVFIVPGLLLILGSHLGPKRTIDTADGSEGVATRSRSRGGALVQIIGGVCIIVAGCVIFLVTSYVQASGLVD